MFPSLPKSTVSILESLELPIKRPKHSSNINEEVQGCRSPFDSSENDEFLSSSNFKTLMTDLNTKTTYLVRKS